MKRTNSLHIRLTDEELTFVKVRAAKAKLKPAVYARNLLTGKILTVEDTAIYGIGGLFFLLAIQKLISNKKEKL